MITENFYTTLSSEKHTDFLYKKQIERQLEHMRQARIAVEIQLTVEKQARNAVEKQLVVEKHARNAVEKQLAVEKQERIDEFRILEKEFADMMMDNLKADNVLKQKLAKLIAIVAVGSIILVLFFVQVFITS